LWIKKDTRLGCGGGRGSVKQKEKERQRDRTILRIGKKGGKRERRQAIGKFLSPLRVIALKKN